MKLHFYLLAVVVAPVFSSLVPDQSHSLATHARIHAAAKGLHIPEAQMQDFFDNFAAIRDWIENDVLAGPKAGPKGMGKEDSEICALCSTVGGIVVAAVRGGGMTEVKDFLNLICALLMDPEVCMGAIDIYTDPLQYIVVEKPHLRAHDICGIYTGVAGGCDPINSTLIDWTIRLNANKPPVQSPPLLPSDTPTAKILHLTDIHPDLHYVVGSDKNCGKPLCCRGEPVDEVLQQAGPHGDNLCDMPESAMLELFQDAKNRYDDYAFVLMTGDLVHHEIWNTNTADNLAHYDAVNRPLVEMFPDTPIYPVIGNHEPHPCNMFPPRSIWGVRPEFNVSWVYNSIADSYAKWLAPDEDRERAMLTFRRAGYYTLLTHPGGPRLIAINTNFCYINNFWIFYDSIDPESQLQWLSDTLFAAESAGEIVYIAGHIPPGKDDCWTVWSEKFNRIILRYEGIIKAQFYGHTHNDETTIFFDKSVEPPRPANTLNIGASTTAYTNLNPGYKVFFADGVRPEATWEMLDHETWVYNLTAANLAGADVPPQWYKLYSMRDAFDLPSLRPSDLYDLVVAMVNDNNLFQKYYEYYYKGSQYRGTCSSLACRLDFLCSMVTSDSSDLSNCERLQQIAAASKVN